VEVGTVSRWRFLGPVKEAILALVGRAGHQSAAQVDQSPPSAADDVPELVSQNPLPTLGPAAERTSFTSMVMPLRVADTVEGYVGLRLDTSALSKVEAARAHLEQMFEQTEMGIVVSGADGETLGFMNPAFACMHGYTRTELTGKPIAFVFETDARATLPAHIEAANRLGRVVFESVHARKDGSTFPVHIDVTAVKDPLGRVLYRVAFVQDISERVAARLALHASEARYRELFMSDLFAVVIAEVGSWQLTDVNPAWLKLYGYEMHEAMALTIPQTSAEPEVTRGALAAAAAGGRFHVEKRWHVKKDGTKFPVEILGTVFHINGQQLLCSTIKDITARVEAEQALRSSEEKLRGLFEMSPLGITLTDMSGRYVEFNEAFRQICGYSVEELNALGNWTLTPKNYEADEAHQLQSLTDTGRYGPYEKECVRKDGTLVPLQLNGVLVTGSDGRRYIWSIVEDISERKRADSALASREKYFRGLAELASDCYWETDQDGRITALVPTRLPWLKPESLLGRTFSELPRITEVAAQEMESLNARMRRFESFRDFDFGVSTSDGQTYYLRCSGMPLHDKDGTFVGYRGMVQNITAQRKARLRAEFLAQHDDLTGLPNRTAMTEHAQLLIDAHQPFVLLLVDLDRFKVINDSLGHHIGDAMLRKVAMRLTALPGQHPVFRLGGDEFVLLVRTEADADKQLNEAVALVLGAIDEPFSVEGYVLNSGCSIGVATFPEDGRTLSEILKDADTAMYRAKKEGSGGFHRYSAEMQATAMDRLHLETDLREAFRAERLQLHYQPRVSVQTGELLGMEALLRWTHPKRGMVSPADFIPIAEETGLILPMGEWVLRTACAQAKAWMKQQSLPLILAVNISPRQFHRGLAAVVQRVLEATGLPPQCLELEITETALMANIDEAIRVMSEITGLGVRLALDDFGTGYSSLTHLKRFPLEVLKLDRSFVHDVADRQDDRVIVNSVVAMAHSLGLRVVAEGVETEAQRLVLQELGCDEYQGFLFSKALSPEEFAVWNFGKEKAAMPG
jgi:diguanylate cyclase (GGDEF)-like protein/PAS domain S-box-containing protein